MVHKEKPHSCSSNISKSNIDYKALIDNSLDVVWKMDLRMRFTYVSPSIYTHTGFTVDEWVGSKLSEHSTPKEYYKMARIALSEIRRLKNRQAVRFQTVMLNKKGEAVDFEIVSRIVCDKNGMPKEITGSTRNISERIKYEKEIKKNNLIKDKFFSIVAHDLKNSFCSMLGFSDLLVDMVENIDDEKVRKFTNLLNNNIQNTYNYLNNLLEWSRSQTNSIQYNPDSFKFIDLLKEVFNIVNLQAKIKSVTINYEIDKELTIWADYKMIETVVLNLITNAIKYTKKGGSILIKGEQSLHEFKCIVSDNGIGICKERLNNIFIIEEAKSTLGTNNETGTGLGLILSKEFIERHKGSIGVKSKLKKGSTFWFSLPTKKI